MPRANSSYTHNFMVNFWVFKDDEPESEAKTNSGPQVCLLLVEGPHFVCVEHAQRPLLAHRVSTYARARTYTHRFGFCCDSRCKSVVFYRVV